MPRINLLPWRDELRKQRQKNFSLAAVAAVAMGAVVYLLYNNSINSSIEYQQVRNQFLEAEIALLDEQINEIIDLEAQKERLLARMAIIEQLQKSRPQVVHLIDELVATLPEGVQLTSVAQSGDRLEIKGVAQSSSRISNYMRNIDASDWMGDPDLGVVEVSDQGRRRTAIFTLFATQENPQLSAEEGSE
ncbi:MAG: PilN domain-containing protein [Gammaproteobacteria bacterium]|nr:PilN domain-containing protein [Gammaproteobacteria bacterium]